MKFYCIASGSRGNCTIIEADNHYLMIDCGGLKRHLSEVLDKINISASQLDALLITHGHKDHIGLIKNFRNTPMMGTFEYEDYNIHQISTHCHFKRGIFDITTIPLSHDYNATVGFKIVVGDETLVYVTDTGYVNARLFEEISNADYYIFESNHDPAMLMQTTRDIKTKRRIISDQGHLCNRDSANILAQLVGERTKEIFLAHVSSEANTYELPLQVIQEVFDTKQVNYQKIRIEVLQQWTLVIGGSLRCDHD